jgi:hypothetical protein
MSAFKFKELEIKKEGSWLKRNIQSGHLQKTLLYSVIGMAAGYVLFYFNQNAEVKSFWNQDALNHVLGGFGLGVFITNSPCASGKC